MTEFLSFTLLEWLGIIIMIFIHELGHAIMASIYGRTVYFSWRGFGPVTIHGLVEGQPLTPVNKLQLISFGGYLFNLLTLPLMVPLFEYNYIKYLSLITVGSLLDFNTIYKRIKNDREG